MSRARRQSGRWRLATQFVVVGHAIALSPLFVATGAGVVMSAQLVPFQRSASGAYPESAPLTPTAMQLALLVHEIARRSLWISAASIPTSRTAEP